MSGIGVVKSILREYGSSWVFNRLLYSLKLKMLCVFPFTEKLFEKKAAYPSRTDLFRIDNEVISSFLTGLGHAEKSALMSAADNACSGVIRGFSHLELNYGSPIDWQLNPLTGKKCDENLKWYRIPDFDKERGDVKVIWEASRFSHFVTLARAFLLTGDKKYYEAFSNQLRSWVKNNPYGCGANFKCGQECSLRMINLLLAYTVFKNSGVAVEADENNVRETVYRCYRKILSNFFYAYRCIKNNHTVSELTGMIVGAWCCEDKKRLLKAYAMLDKVVTEQFSADGGYQQFSFNYQRLALQDLECVLSLESVTDRSLSHESKERIKNAALLLYQCQDVSGDLPNYGSNDGALIFPVTSCGYRDFRPVINTSYALCTGRRLFESGVYDEEFLWFSNGRLLETLEKAAVERVSSAFPQAGLFTLRRQNLWAMLVLNDYKSRPAHMDQLHFDLWADGINVLCDCGTYSYADDTGRILMKNESHNTAVVSGRCQMNTRGPFMVFDRTIRNGFSHGEIRFEGDMTSRNGYRHKRIAELTDDGVTLTDEVDMDCTLVFHTPCQVLLEDGRALVIDSGRTLCEITSSGVITTADGVRSIYYLGKLPATRIHISGRAGEKITTKIIFFKGENND